MITSTFAERMQYAMKNKGYKQVDLLKRAEREGVKLGKSQVSQYVSGDAVPRRNIGAFLANALEVELAKQLQIDEVHSQLLPADKVLQVERLLEQQNGKGRLAFVGDGINDAPVLSRADIGIAMGAMGSDAAIEAADVVLMDDNPMKIATAIGISRKCIRIVYQNIYFAIGIKLLCLLLGALGIANMWVAVFADVGVMVLAVLNAIRVLFYKPEHALQK